MEGDFIKMKYRTLYERKFENHTGFFIGMEAMDNGIVLSFEDVPMTVLHHVADELISDGFCNEAEVADGKIMMIEAELLFCSEDELKDIVREVMKENNYELIFNDR